MRDATGGNGPREYEQSIKELKKKIGIIILIGAIIGGAKYIDYRNSFKDEGINEIYELDDEEFINDDSVKYEEDSLRYNTELDPYLVSEDSTSFVKRTIRNDNPVKKLKRKKR